MNALSQKVSMAEKIGYSLGDCSANLVFQMMMIYQTKFYTDVFGLEGAIAGSVMLIARIVDAFVDPTGHKPNGANTAHGYSGLHCRSWCSMCWHSTIPVSRIKVW